MDTSWVGRALTRWCLKKVPIEMHASPMCLNSRRTLVADPPASNIAYRGEYCQLGCSFLACLAGSSRHAPSADTWHCGERCWCWFLCPSTMFLPMGWQCGKRGMSGTAASTGIGTLWTWAPSSSCPPSWTLWNRDWGIEFLSVHNIFLHHLKYVYVCVYAYSFNQGKVVIRS